MDAPAAGASGDDDFADWVEPFLQAMANLASRLTSTAERDDVVQEALVRAWRRRSTYDPDRGSPKVWLLAIVADRARRHRGRRCRSTAALADGAAVEGGVDSGERIDLDRAVARLSGRQELAVSLHYFVGLTVAETAGVMGCAAGTVKSTLSDARSRLREMLMDLDQELRESGETWRATQPAAHMPDLGRLKAMAPNRSRRRLLVSAVALDGVAAAALVAVAMWPDRVPARRVQVATGPGSVKLPAVDRPPALPQPAGCPFNADDQPVFERRPAPGGTDRQMVPGAPTAVTICRFERPLVGPMISDRRPLTNAAVFADPQVAQALAAMANRARVAPTRQIATCKGLPPTTSHQLLFGYGDRTLLSVDVGRDSCVGVANGTLTAWMPDGLPGELDRLAPPPTKATVVPGTPGVIPNPSGLGSELKARFPALYGGIVGDGTSGTTTTFASVIAETKRDPQLEAYALAHGHGLSLRFVLCQHSYVELVRLRDRITREHDQLVAQGIELTMWGPDEIDNRVLVGLSRVTPKAVAALQARYGADLLIIVEEQPATAASGGPIKRTKPPRRP